jgi:hypothetical protein
MVRPRASDRNLNAATAFGSMMVVRVGPKDLLMSTATPIPCNGPRSIYALFSACLPHISRDAREKQPKNRSGVTMVELNKALHNAGLRYWIIFFCQKCILPNE